MKHNFINQRLNNYKEFRIPFLSICSPIRSGGNMLLRMFDGKTDVLTYPHEELFGLKSHYYYSKSIVDKFRLNNIKYSKNFNSFEQIHLNKKILNFFSKNGYIKSNYNDPLPFLYSENLHKKLFLKLSKIKCTNKKMLLENYMIAYFNSHIDYQNFYAGNKKFVCNYWPELINFYDDIKELLKLNKKNTILYVLRNPYHWYASVKFRKFKKNSNINFIENIWMNSLKNFIRFKKKYPNRVFIIEYESLVNNSKKTLSKLCKQINLKFEDSMLVPTINNLEIASNSSFSSYKKKGIVKRKNKIILDKSEINYIYNNFIPIYEDTRKKYL